MVIDRLSEQEIAILEDRLLAEVPESGTIGNVSLRNKLRIDEDTYWFIRNRLIDRGILETGRGKGGSVRRVASVATADEASAGSVLSAAPEAIAERELYAPMAQVIRDRWVQDYQLDAYIVEITAHQGSRPTHGRWTRPDITVASLKTFAYVPGKHFDLITFEVKSFESLDVTVIYEALSHRRAATRAYALIYVPEDRQGEVQPILDEVEAEAKRYGIGLIVASKPDDYDTWEELVEAVRYEPNPERLNRFLAQQVTQGFREQLVRWFR